MRCIEPITVREVAKKPKAKAEPKISEEETAEPEKELNIPVPDQKGIIDFYYLCCGAGIVIVVLMIAYIPLHYLFHII